MIYPMNDDEIITQIVLPNEGGYTNNPNDPGGVTKLICFRSDASSPKDPSNYVEFSIF